MRGMNVKYRTGVGRDGDIQLVALRLAQGKLTAHGGQEKKSALWRFGQAKLIFCQLANLARPRLISEVSGASGTWDSLPETIRRASIWNIEPAEPIFAWKSFWLGAGYFSSQTEVFAF